MLAERGVRHNVMRMLCIAMMLALAITKGAAQDTNRTIRIEQAIDQMLAGPGHKVEMQPLIDRIASFREAAVPSLIQRYEKTDDDRCWPLMSCMCQIGTDTSLNFVRQVLSEHKKKWATSRAIKDYPISKEDDIAPELIDLVGVREQSYDAVERLKKMIDRKPSRAGQLVGALRDDHSLEAYEYELGEILAFVSGYSHTWCVGVPPGQDAVAYRNNFWREWWARNKDNGVFEWLQEAVISDNESRQAEALQRLWAIGDKRATPYFRKALDSLSNRVQYWAVVGLKGVEGTMPKSGYLSETFDKEKDSIIPALKLKFSKTDEAEPTTGPTVPPEARAPGVQ